MLAGLSVAHGTAACARRGRGRGQALGEARSRSGRRGLTPIPVGACLCGCWWAAGRCWAFSSSGWWALVASWPGSRSGEQTSAAARSSLRGARRRRCHRGRMMGSAEDGGATVGRGQSEWLDHAARRHGWAGVMTCTASRPTVVAGGLMPRLHAVAAGGGLARGGRAGHRTRARPVGGPRRPCRCSSRAWRLPGPSAPRPGCVGRAC